MSVTLQPEPGACSVICSFLKISYDHPSDEYHSVVADTYDPHSGVNGMILRMTYEGYVLLLFGGTLYYRVYRSHDVISKYHDEIAIQAEDGYWSMYRILESGDLYDKAKTIIRQFAGE